MKRYIISILLLININLLAQIEEIDDPFQKGKVEDGYRVGDWHYYGLSRNVELTFDYDSNRIIYLKPDTASYLIYEDSWKAVKPDRQIRFLGSYASLYDLLAFNLSRSYSSDAAKKNINTIILLELEFSEKGQLLNKNLIGEHKEYFEEPILTVAASIPEYWIPALYNGAAVKSKIAFPLIYTTKTSEKKQPKIEDLDYQGKMLTPITIVGYGVGVRR